MTEWRTPVYDRTLVDVKTAKENRGSADYQKGALNADDLNRIEGNYHWLTDELEKEGYYHKHIHRGYTETTLEENDNGVVVPVQRTYTDWQEQNIPWKSEMDRIRRNLNSLVRPYLEGLGLPVFSESSSLTFDEVNDWERVELVGKDMLEKMKKEYRYCGVTKTGDERLV